jgi:SARP family transcriptional regulator, regulator of embCAB operon
VDGVVVCRERWDYLGAGLAQTRVQLCGKLVVELDGARIEDGLPGRQGRLLFSFLVVNRDRSLARDELVAALWPDGHDGGLAPLLSKLRRLVPLDHGRIVLPADAYVDVEVARDSVHRAESALAQREFHQAWAPAQIARSISARVFMLGEDADWIEEQRRDLAALRVRALEAYALAGLGLGGTELPGAVRAGRELIALEPYRETGHRILMQALSAEGNDAEALRVYDDLRRLLHDELGTAPSAPTQDLHRQLLT